MATVGQGFSIDFNAGDPLSMENINAVIDQMREFPRNYKRYIEGTIKVSGDFPMPDYMHEEQPTSLYTYRYGDTYKQLKSRKKRRANKTILSHKKRKRLYKKPVINVFRGYISETEVMGATANIKIKVLEQCQNKKRY